MNLYALMAKAVEMVPVVERWHLGPDGQPDYHDVEVQLPPPAPVAWHHAAASCACAGCQSLVDDAHEQIARHDRALDRIAAWAAKAVAAGW